MGPFGTPPPPAPPRPVSPREYALIAALQSIVLETMPYPPVRPYSSESYLPEKLVEQAQQALAAYGLRCQAVPDIVTRSL